MIFFIKVQPDPCHFFSKYIPVLIKDLVTLSSHHIEKQPTLIAYFHLTYESCKEHETVQYLWETKQRDKVYLVTQIFGPYEEEVVIFS